MSQFAIALLGPLRVGRDGAPVTGFESDKVRALLAYLAVERGRPHRRSALAALLWPERPEKAALLNLNQALANLRRAVGDRDAAQPLLLSGRESIQLSPAADVQVDVAAFEELLAACAAHAHRSAAGCAVCAARRAEAVALYGGAFLDGLAPRDCLGFEEWALVTRERLHRQLLEALEALAAHHEQRDDLPAALAAARRLAELDPWREEAHRGLMRLLWRAGRRGEALAQYERCRAALAADLGLAPDAETEELHRAILAGRPWDRGTGGQGDKGSGEPVGAAGAPPAPPLTPSPALPIPPTPFVGREAELALLADRLGDPACRMVSIVGLGGAGKTRLALQAAAAQQGAFADGVHWVPLAALERADELLPAVARALGLAPGGADDAAAQLAAHLHAREMLLVLDNLEQLRAAVPALTALLEQAPRLTILATSRERLGLRAEWVLDLAGLGLPAGPGEAQIAGSGAGALFLGVARRARGYFVPDATERGSIARICAALDGHALAVELAASWAHVLSCAEIEAELARGAGLLVGAGQDLPERHRALASVLDATWELLTPAERRALRLLAVFPGSFGVEAAEAVLAEPRARLGALTALAGLINKALLRREPGGAFGAHPFVREYALGRLREAGEEGEACARLLGYAVELVERAEAHLKTADEAAWLNRLAVEHAGIGAALEWALARGAAAEAARLCAVLRWLWYIRGYIGEGRRWMERCVALARGAVEPRLLARLLQGAGILADEDGDHAAAAAHYAEGLAIFRALGDSNGVRIVTNSLGVLLNTRGRYAEARVCFEECLRLSRELGQRFGEATSLNNLGILARNADDAPAARAAFEAALAVSRSIGYETLITTVLDNLGGLALAGGDTPGALAAYGEALALQRAAGDTRGAAISLRGLGAAALAQGDAPGAEGPLFESLALTLRSPGPADLAAAVEAVAELLAALGRHGDAARLAGAAEGCRERISAALTAAERSGHQRAVALMRGALGPEAFALAWAAGRALPIEAAAEQALAGRAAAGG